MPLHIDHISLASPHIFRSADTLSKETGLGYWTGEWLRDSSVNIVPLGPPGNFIEISGFIDIFSLRHMDERKQWILDITETGDHFNGLCLGVDSMDELEMFAKHWKSTVNRADNPDPAAHFQRANGYILPVPARDGAGSYDLVASPVQFDEMPPELTRAPDSGEHTDQILADELGLDQEAIRGLRASAVVS